MKTIELSAHEVRIIISAMEAEINRLAGMIQRCERNRDGHPAIHRLRGEAAAITLLVAKIR